VAAVFGDQSLTAELNALNAALYSPSGETWQGTALAEAATRLRKQHHKARRERHGKLQLYPTPAG